MSFSFVMRPQAYDDGYLTAHHEYGWRPDPALLTEDVLSARIAIIDNATARRSFLLCLVDRRLIPLSVANRILSNTARPGYIERGIPDCYFDQPRPI
jgi:hypothetical protein